MSVKKPTMRDIAKDVMYYHFCGNQMTACYNDDYNALSLDYFAFEAQHPGFTLHGYVIGNDRNDARITAEGVQGTARDIEAMFDFIETFRCADDCDTNRETRGCYCWYD